MQNLREKLERAIKKESQQFYTPSFLLLKKKSTSHNRQKFQFQMPARVEHT